MFRSWYYVHVVQIHIDSQYRTVVRVSFLLMCDIRRMLLAIALSGVVEANRDYN